MSLADALKNGSPEDIERQALDTEKARLRRQQQAKREVAAESHGPVPQLLGLTVQELAAYRFPPRQPLLYRGDQMFLHAGQIAEFFSRRGVGKTWFMGTLALLMSSGGKAMGFEARRPFRVLYLDGEMARHDIQERFDKLAECTGLDRTDHLVIVAADWQEAYLPRLDTTEGQAALEPFIEPADVVFFDNRGCLFDAEGEKDPTAWQAAGQYLLSLRRRDKTSILGHHSNRQGGARGIGKPEDQMDLVGKLAHPDDYTANDGARFTVTFDPPDGKARGLWGKAAAPFGLRLTPNGWVVEAAGGDPGETAIRQQIIDYLRIADVADDRPKSANAALGKINCNRQKGLKVWGEMLRDREIVGDKKDGYKIGVLKPVPF